MPRYTRSAAGVAVSVTIHAIAGTALFLLVQAQREAKPAGPRRPLFVMTFLQPPALIHVDAPSPVKLTAPARVPQLVETPAVPAPEIAPPPPPNPRPIEIDRPHVEPVPAPVAEVVRPRPAPVKPTVGVFDAPSPNPSQPAEKGTVLTAGFDAPKASAPDLRSVTAGATVGAFDSRPSTGPARTGTDTPRRIVDPGFGGGGGSPVARSTGPAADVRSGGFDVQPAQPAARAAVDRQAPIDTPVEILFKPTPVYSAEARDLKLEGDVVLEVEFCASKQVRVLRVIRGIGHGLDESAARAAEQIRFKPAQANGRAVDFRSTLHIVFRLT